MGFRCPNCKKDFGMDEYKLKEHFEFESGECAAIADATVTAIDIIVGTKKPKNKRSEIKHKPMYSHVDENHTFRKINAVTNSDGFDSVECIRCGLKGKRQFSRYVFDRRISNKKIEQCTPPKAKLKH